MLAESFSDGALNREERWMRVHAAVGAAVPMVPWDAGHGRSVRSQVARGCVESAEADAVAQEDQVYYQATFRAQLRRRSCGASQTIVLRAVTAERRGEREHDGERERRRGRDATGEKCPA